MSEQETNRCFNHSTWTHTHTHHHTSIFVRALIVIIYYSGLKKGRLGWNWPFLSHFDYSGSFGAKAEEPFVQPACTALLPAGIDFPHIAQPFRRSYRGVSGGISRPFPAISKQTCALNNNNTQPGPHSLQQRRGCVGVTVARLLFSLLDFLSRLSCSAFVSSDVITCAVGHHRQFEARGCTSTHDCFRLTVLCGKHQ